MVPLLAINVFMLVAGNLLSILPVLVQLPLVVTLVRNHPRQLLFTRLWSGLIATGGALGWLSSAANFLAGRLDPSQASDDALASSTMILNSIALGFGSFIFWRCSRWLTNEAGPVATGQRSG
jgi:hypothetical protein